MVTIEVSKIYRNGMVGYKCGNNLKGQMALNIYYGGFGCKHICEECLKIYSNEVAVKKEEMGPKFKKIKKDFNKYYKKINPNEASEYDNIEDLEEDGELDEVIKIGEEVFVKKWN